MIFKFVRRENMSAFLRFPGFKTKAFTLSYDDGPDFDKRLIEIMNKYGIKGTFNVHTRDIGADYGKGEGWHQMSEDELLSMYKESGNEIAVHGNEHFSLTDVDLGMATREILLNREYLEKKFGKIVRGMAYANGAISDKAIEIVGNCGIDYARTVTSTYSFDIPKNWLLLNPTCHHSDSRLFELADKFLNGGRARYMWADKPRLFYVWGHSFEFHTANNWDVIERLCEMVGGHDDVWYVTNGEIYEYVRAYNSLVYSCDGSIIHNPTSTDVYLEYFRKEIVIPAGKTVVAR
jgi:peptidoglycan/xylan/chitin deacetylase (PgdA/CDA1 family)